MKKYLFYILLLISTVSFSQKKPLVKAEIDTTNIRIGEQFNLKISVNETKNVIIPKLELKGLEIIDSTKVDTIKNSLVKKYVLTGFDSGSFYIPQQQIFVKNQAFLTDSLLVNVATVTVDTTKIKKFPIKSIKNEPYVLDDFKGYLWYVLLALLIISFLIYYFVFRKKKEEIEEEIIPALPAFEEAIEKLHQLDEKLLWQNNKVKQYYSELTEIVRNYIGRDIEIPTFEQTSQEIIELVEVQNDTKKLGLSKETIATISSLLKNADLVKFAKSKPLSNEIEDDRKSAEIIIKKIQPKVVEYKSTILAQEPEASLSNEVFGENANQQEKIVVKPTKKKSKKKRNLIIFIIVFIIFFIGAYFIGSKVMSFISKYADTTKTEQLLNDRWVKKTYGNPPLTIETPLILKAQEIPNIPPEVKKLVDNMEGFQYKSLVNGLEINIATNLYVPNLQANLKGAVDGAVAELQKQPTISNFKHQTEAFNKLNVTGGRIFGTFDENNIKKKFEAIILVEDNKMWLVSTSHILNDESAEKIVERIINSIKIDTKNVE
jgi:flagellar basal body-associated protein FliL